jgi:hypothetical protein
MPTRSIVLLALFPLVACAPTRFISSDSAFVGARRPSPPSMFLDQAPPRPWRSVGMIEVKLSGNASNEQVIAMALEAGQEAGCELLSQPQKKHGSAARPFTLQLAVLRDGHDHGDHPPPAPEREAPAQRESLTSAPTSSTSSSSSAGGAEAPVSAGGGAGRVRRWRFECGVYSDDGAAAGATSTLQDMGSPRSLDGLERQGVL